MSAENNNGSFNRYAWIILAVVYLATFAGRLMLNKVSPLVVDLADDFGITMSQVGLLMSMLGLTGLFLAIPGGIILQRLGLRITGTAALIFLAGGATLGAISGSFNFLLFSRMLEGIGLALIVVVSPAAIAMWFPQEKVGTSIGIWTTSAPISAFVIVTLAPLLAPTIGWRGVWWLTAGVSITALVLYWLLMKPAPALAASGRPDVDGSTADAVPGWKITLRNKDIWLLGLAILIFSLLITPFLTYYVTFLSSVHDFPLSRAGLIFGLASLATVPAGPLTGWVSDSLGTRKWVAIAGFLILCPLYVLIYQLSGFMNLVALVLMSVIAITIPVSILAAVPEVMPDVRLVGIGMAVIIFGQNLGLIIGPPLFGGLVEGASWGVAAYAFAPLCLLGALVVFLTRRMP